MLSPQQARPVRRRPDTPEVVERPKASQDVVDALAKRYPSRRKEASLLVSALRVQSRPDHNWTRERSRHVRSGLTMRPRRRAREVFFR